MTRLRNLWPMIAASCVAAFVCVDQLSQAHALFGIDEYDDGVYFGGALRLVHGVLPYRDFVFPHPPGILIILAPFAALADWTGTRWLVAEGRILTAVVAVANVFLISWLVRHRGVAASLAAGVALAVYPMAVTADKTVMLEPYLVLFVLLGLTFLFTGDALQVGTGRLIMAGAFFGFAGVVKVWAIFPAIAAAACCLPQVRSRLLPFVAGAATSFLIPVTAFGLPAPTRFIRDVITGQVNRGSVNVSASERLPFLTGLRGIPALSDTIHVAIVLAVVFLAIVLLGLLPSSGRLTRLDIFALLAASLSIGVLLKAPEYSPHYGYFAAPFATLALALAIGRISGWAPGGYGTWAAVAAIAVLGFAGAFEGWKFIRDSPGWVTLGDPGLAIQREIPAGACVVTDQPAYTITANRFTSNTPGCPTVVDPFFVWLLADPHDPPPSNSVSIALTNQWTQWLAAANYIVVSPNEGFIPFTTEMTATLNQDFRELPNDGSAYVFERVQ